MKVLDSVEKELEADSVRFGTRVSEEELADKRKKKYVHFFIILESV